MPFTHLTERAAAAAEPPGAHPGGSPAPRLRASAR
eukprot:CAMPEP_0183790840 /NCGR_PEP_ID=MMETSP0803_2-20130417/1412_1 /TAXON_ID=195967 /ORGANISM="Crustomastix stigmata, Strain CCMP3273" /LENGTH=34 /DNA_ID= /DNA_START= /DNA_END= /DNA_ORIENTATION=